MKYIATRTLIGSPSFKKGGTYELSPKEASKHLKEGTLKLVKAERSARKRKKVEKTDAEV